MNHIYQRALIKCAEIQKLIEQDVNSRYNQDNPPEPYSHLFIDDKENWRCYIFGVIGGILLQSPKHRNGFVSMTYIDEDDGHWFISESPIDTCDAEWVEDKIRLYHATEEWLKENCNRGYYSGCEGVAGCECGYKYPKTK